MPIYEFYCSRCHTIFSFLARSVHTEKRPSCPQCGRPRLERRPSRFAISKNRPAPEEGQDFPDDVDDAKLEQVFADMERDADGIDENDPRAMARLMRKLNEATGNRFDENMEEAIRRLEAGEDPDAIEESMGDLLSDEEPSSEPTTRGQRLLRKFKPPRVDETLYDM
ncbi:MAG: zinc ribbon domain-containing protein [Planctomycetes bacterium]|nr:zinc ribbon domain-containing protein [Planctomycetota bacterium]